MKNISSESLVHADNNHHNYLLETFFQSSHNKIKK